MSGFRSCSFNTGVGCFFVGLSLLVLTGVCPADGLSSFRTVPISVSGTVIDAQGRPVREVQMTILEGRPQGNSFEISWSRRHRTIDGGFEVRCEDCADLRLRFQAEGFYPKEIGFKLTDAEAKRLLTGQDGDGFSLVRQGLIVELEPSVNPVNLDWTSVVLDVLEDGPMRVLAAEKGRVRGTIERTVFSKRQKAGGGGGGPAMVALKAAPGQFEALVRKTTGYEAEAAPNAVFLEFSGGMTGVIPIDSPEGNYKTVYRSMIEAPEEGYVDHLVIDPNSDRRQYFYCRIGDLFGKGSVSSLRAAYGRDSIRILEVGIEVYLNRDGSRNLDSLEY